MVIGKGITGGMYPIACVVVSEECSAWLKEDGFGHISTGGGSELGCVVSLKVLEICGRPEVRSMTHPMYGRPLVNRNPDQNARDYRRGRDFFTWQTGE